MPLERPDAELAGTRNDAIGILTIETHNDLKNYAPRPRTVTVKSVVQNNKKSVFTFQFDEPDKELGERGILITGSVELPAGEYFVTELAGTAGVFPLVGRFAFNPDWRFTLRAGEFAYLGRVTARLVEKTSQSQERAGPILPLIDQAATGFSYGTFQIDVQDRFTDDIPPVVKEHPFLEGKTIRVELLKPAGSGRDPVSEGAEPESPAKDSALGTPRLRKRATTNSSVASGIERRLQTLENLRERGVISKNEYDLRRSEILGEL